MFFKPVVGKKCIFKNACVRVDEARIHTKEGERNRCETRRQVRHTIQNYNSKYYSYYCYWCEKLLSLDIKRYEFIQFTITCTIMYSLVFKLAQHLWELQYKGRHCLHFKDFFQKRSEYFGYLPWVILIQPGFKGLMDLTSAEEEKNITSILKSFSSPNNKVFKKHRKTKLQTIFLKRNNRLCPTVAENWLFLWNVIKHVQMIPSSINLFCCTNWELLLHPLCLLNAVNHSVASNEIYKRHLWIQVQSNQEALSEAGSYWSGWRKMSCIMYTVFFLQLWC